ncbi:MAG: flagellar basal body rod C-terminal domain-containing protein [Terriglobales bacterium]
MDLSAIALQGLDQAQVQLQSAAIKLVGMGADSSDGAGLDTVDLSTEIVALMSAQNQYSANLSTLKTTDQLQQSLLDVTA